MERRFNDEPEIYKEFFELGSEGISTILAKGRIPMNTAQLMQRRLEVRNSPMEVRYSWMSYSFYTSDAVIYNPNGKIKIVLDSPRLRKVISESESKYGSLFISKENYKSLQGEVFKKSELEKIANFPLSKKDVESNPIWKLLARGDQSLVKEYVDLVFAGRTNHPSMGVYFWEDNRKSGAPRIKLWRVKGISTNGSCAYANRDLSRKKLFIGISPGKGVSKSR